MFKNNVFISASEERGASNLALRPSEDETQVQSIPRGLPRGTFIISKYSGLSIQKIDGCFVGDVLEHPARVDYKTSCPQAKFV